MVLRVEGDLTTWVRVGSSARYRGGDQFRAAEFLTARGQVERVKPLEESERAGRWDNGLTDCVDRAGGPINHRRARDSHFGSNVTEAASHKRRRRRDRSFAGRSAVRRVKKIGLPEFEARAGVCVERINAVV